MHLHKLRVWNFRKYGCGESNDSGTIGPGLELSFDPGLNVLVGENDSGKTTVIDAIKFITGTRSNEWNRLEESHFHIDENGKIANWLKIECIFKGISPSVGKYFTEHCSYDEDKEPYLRLTLNAQRKMKSARGAGISYDVRAGLDEDGSMLPAGSRDKMKVTYLRPLRDAKLELSPRRNSRLSQIFKSYDIFQISDDHDLKQIMDEANEKVEKYFSEEDGKEVLQIINNNYLDSFAIKNNKLSAGISITENSLSSILEKLELFVASKGDSPYKSEVGLGSNNLLFMAAELLLLHKERETGLDLLLIEELEAHLHPQAQETLMNFFTKAADLSLQVVLTTHSPVLVSKIDLKNLILFKGNHVYPMGSEYTKLNYGDYEFLRRFLDDTKSNLFFANGVIIVEGPSENILLPALAEIIERPLHRFGVSIVNVNSTALLRYAKIFQRIEEPRLLIPVAVITDRDIPPDLAKENELVKPKRKTQGDYSSEELEQSLRRKIEKYEGGPVKTFVSKQWTLEFDIASSCLRHFLYLAVKFAEESSNLEKDIEIDFSARLDECTKEIEEWETKESRESIAIRIFEPIANKKVSKSVVAQLLAKILRSDLVEIVGDDLGSDESISYLINAIHYVTE